jgi:hypothetical protein
LLSTIVVSNRNAWRHCRAQAALGGTQGVKLFTIDQLAARLAGGFQQPVDGDHLAAAVAEAIKLPLGELDAVKALPGFQRAAASSLCQMARNDEILEVFTKYGTYSRDKIHEKPHNGSYYETVSVVYSGVTSMPYPHYQN